MLDPTVAALDRKKVEGDYPDPYQGATGEECRARGWKIRREIYPAPHIEVGGIEARTIPGPAGDIPVRIVRPVDGPATATVVYYHGGGWIIGDLDSHAAHVARIANRTGAVVVNVDYRLAPEHLFPAAVDDAFAAFDWTRANIAELGGDPARLVVAGDSAGGNLAAATALYARDNDIPLAAQLLIYAATDLRRLAAGAAGSGDTVVAKYLGPDFATVANDWRASPAVASLAGVAPVVMGVGQHDFLYEDNMAFAELLRDAGVPLTLRDYPHLNHSFFGYTGVSKPCEVASDQLCDDLRSVLDGAACT